MFIRSISIKYYKILVSRKCLNNFIRMVDTCIIYVFKKIQEKKIKLFWTQIQTVDLPDPKVRVQIFQTIWI